jgi:hypothetical protein
MFIFRYETYISDIRNISHRNILTRFRTSNHKLHIETGRYTRPITPVENRICSNCNSKSVEDELHFLMYCPRFENHRKELFSNVLNYNAAILSAEDKFVWILSIEDPSCVRENLFTRVFKWHHSSLHAWFIFYLFQIQLSLFHCLPMQTITQTITYNFICYFIMSFFFHVLSHNLCQP